MISLFTSYDLKKHSIFNTLFIFTIAFSICLYFGRSVFADPDTAWHIKAGEIIWLTKSIPKLDSLTFTSDQVWYNISWIWDIVIYLIYKTLDYQGLIYFQAFLFASILTFCYVIRPKDKNFHADTYAIVITLVGLILWDLLYLRPQLISYIFVLIITVLLRKGSKQSVYAIPLIICLWANIHGSFIVAYTIIGAYIIGAFIQKDYQLQRKYCFIFSLSLLAPLINPLGYNIITAVYRTLNSEITSYISEWQPFTFGREYSFTLLILLLLAIGGFTDKKIPLVYKILAFSWLIASLISKRSFGYFGILSIPYLTFLLEPLIAKHPSKFFLTNTAKILLIFSLLALVFFFPLQKLKNHTFDQIPLEGIEFLNNNCTNAKIFNDYNLGGYLALWGKNHFKYFIDGRAGVTFSEKFIKKYLECVYDKNNISSLIKEYPVDLAFISNHLKDKTTYFSYFSNWDIVYSDSMVTIYSNRASKACRKGGLDN